MRRLLSFCLLALPFLSEAATLPYQGILTDASNNPIRDGYPRLVLKLYGGSTDAAALWTESQNTATKNGLFSIYLGSITSIPDSLFARDSLFLGISVANGAELSPRIRFGASPWAIRAIKADTADYARSAAGVGSSFDTAALTAQIANLTARVATLEASVASLTTANTANTANITAILALLKGVKRADNELYFDSVNINIRNGKGSTSTINGLGNLVIGYNERRGTGDDRSGSHVVVVGEQQNYSSYGSLIAGFGNSVSGEYSSVVGGFANRANGMHSSVTGGDNNLASGVSSSVTGGYQDTASGRYATVSGGARNKASGSAASVVGGSRNVASGDSSTVLAGILNSATAIAASVTGGFSNEASGSSSSVTGGAYNSVQTSWSSILGGYSNSIESMRASGGIYSTITGGTSNLILGGDHSTVTAGESQSSNSNNEWIHP